MHTHSHDKLQSGAYIPAVAKPEKKSKESSTVRSDIGVRKPCESGTGWNLTQG